MFLIPVEGRMVIDPATGVALPAEGAEVEASDFWDRRIIDGDVIQTIDDIEQVPPEVPGATTGAVGFASQPVPNPRRATRSSGPFRNVL